MTVVLIIIVSLLLFAMAFTAGYLSKDFNKHKNSTVEDLLAEYREFLHFDGSLNKENDIWKK